MALVRSGGRRQESMSEIIPFLDFARMTEKVSNARTTAEKQGILRKYFGHFRNKFQEIYNTLDVNYANGDSIFSIVRILCPNWDRERSSYGIKDIVLGRMVAKIIGIDKNSSDGKKLYNYKDPGAVGSDAGDIGSIIFTILNRRFSNNDPTNGPTLHELHQILDQLAKNKEEKEEKMTQDKQIKILQSFIRRLGALEGKWLSKIILKKMDLGIQESSILNLVHPKAKELLDTNSLEEVCFLCNDPDSDQVQTGKVGIFACFKPMLCERLNIRNDDEDTEFPHKVINNKSKKNPLTLPPPPFLVETKFDGERFQIHFERNSSTGESTFKYFSRRSFEYKEFSQTLTSRLKDQLVQYPQVQSFIIDGEMMAFNYTSKNFTTKGQNIDVKTLRSSDGIHCPAFVAWDIVFLNGQSVSEKPLMTRMDLLKKVLIPKESVYYISDQKLCQNLNDVIRLLDEAIENCEEGVVIKDRNSIYEPGQRKPTWLKLKPEYVEGCRVTDLDLLIIGGNYADRKQRGGKVTSLLLGILDGKDIYPLTRVGCGRLKHSEMASLIKSLEPHFTKQEIPGIKFRGTKRPDVFIDPKKSIVLEVNASEIIYTKDYSLNYCLRFPVVSKIRRDKPWNEVMSVSEFHDLRLSCKKGKMVRKRGAESVPGPSKSIVKKQYFGQHIDFDESSSDDETGRGITGLQQHRLNQKKITNGSSETEPKKSKVAKLKVTVGVSPSKILAITSAAMAAAETARVSSEGGSNIFQGKVFSVLGSWEWKTDIELKIKLHGGEIVKNLTSDTFAIVAEKETETVKHKKIAGKHDILRGIIWINKCIQEKSIVTFLPEDLFFAAAGTSEIFSSMYDPYGDSYTAEISVHNLKPLLQKITQENVIPELKERTNSQGDTMKNELEEIRYGVDQEIFHKDTKFINRYFFRPCCIVFWPKMNFALKANVEFYGGTVLEDMTLPTVTHIILPVTDESSKTNHIDSNHNSTASVLTEEWIEACVQKKYLVSAFPFLVSS